MESIIANYTAGLPSPPISNYVRHVSAAIPSPPRPHRRFVGASAVRASSHRPAPSAMWAPPSAADGLSVGAPRMPSFEELDAANMLLKQRIVFLGSQSLLLSSIAGRCYSLIELVFNDYVVHPGSTPKIGVVLYPVMPLYQVDTMTADLVIGQLLFLDAEDQKKDIKLFINSPGGSVTAGMGIYDAMKLCQADVSTVCFGLAASMGAFLLAAGTKGKRYCMPNARIMIHQPLGTAGGRTTDMGLQIREMMYHKIKMAKIMSRITGKPEHQIETDTDRDNFMNPWEAKEYGLVDAVIDDGKPGLIAPIVEPGPPPKTRVWSLWKIEGSKKARKNLPSETRISEIGREDTGAGGDEEKGSEGAKEAQAPA